MPILENIFTDETGDYLSKNGYNKNKFPCRNVYLIDYSIGFLEDTIYLRKKLPEEVETMLEEDDFDLILVEEKDLATLPLDIIKQDGKAMIAYAKTGRLNKRSALDWMDIAEAKESEELGVVVGISAVEEFVDALLFPKRDDQDDVVEEAVVRDIAGKFALWWNTEELQSIVYEERKVPDGDYPEIFTYVTSELRQSSEIVEMIAKYHLPVSFYAKFSCFDTVEDTWEIPFSETLELFREVYPFDEFITQVKEYESQGLALRSPEIWAISGKIFKLVREIVKQDRVFQRKGGAVSFYMKSQEDDRYDFFTTSGEPRHFTREELANFVPRDNYAVLRKAIQNKRTTYNVLKNYVREADLPQIHKFIMENA